MSTSPSVPYTTYGELDPEALKQLARCTAAGTGAVRAALMPDHHVGYSMPIGGVVAYRGKVSPSGVGYDIGCGNKAVELDLLASEVQPLIKGYMDDIWRDISFGMGGQSKSRDAKAAFDALDDDPGWKVEACQSLRELARSQLGTVGAGNHFVDVLRGACDDSVWVGVHFGSRGFGHKLATHFVKAGGGRDGFHTEPVLFDAESDLGAQYVAAMRLAGRYAHMGRDWVCGRVAELMGAGILGEVHNHHNFAWYEEQDGEMLWVHRKGATPAWPGQTGFVGGSMGDPSYIVIGNDLPASRDSLQSTVHGAGRAMSRREAAGKWRWRKRPDGRRHREQVSEGKVTPAMLREAVVEKAGVELRGGGLDEAPQAYKRIEEVVGAHERSGAIGIINKLLPMGVAMASAGVDG